MMSHRSSRWFTGLLGLSRTGICQWVILGLCASWVPMAWSADEFGAGWQPKPLVDTTQPVKSAPVATDSKSGPAAATAVSAPATPSVEAVQKAQEAQLKPLEPFIHDVETQLGLVPVTGTRLVQRLNTVQQVLYGEQKYQDAGELIAQLAKLFPQAAAKAEASLNQQIQNPQAIASQGKKTGKDEKAGEKNKVVSSQQSALTSASGGSSTGLPPGVKLAKPKKHRWGQDDWGDDPFKNDPFFNSSATSSATYSGTAYSAQPSQGAVQQTPAYSSGSYPSDATYNNNSANAYGAGAYNSATTNGPSRLGAVAQGLAGLAMVAGGLAGTYYLNKKMGNTNANGLPNNGYYNNGYYNNGYYNNGYGYTPYGVPYGGGVYGVPPGYYYPQAGGYSVTTTPYSPYGNYATGGTAVYPYGSTYGNRVISPLGVPTGLLPY